MSQAPEPTPLTQAEPTPLRQLVYTLLIVVAAGLVGGRIMSVARIYEPYFYRDEGDPKDKRQSWRKVRPNPVPTHGDNDRSRWDTIRALVENGTYAIGVRTSTGPKENDFVDSGICTTDGWVTIDKILDPQTQKFYSSKPPLLPTILAGEYWLLFHAPHWVFHEHWSLEDPNKVFWVVRTILMTVNWFPFVLSLWILSRVVERIGTTDWGRLFVVATACFGTLVTPFSTTLNNHTVAAWSLVFALAPAVAIFSEGRRQPALFACCGLFAGFLAVTELPAASLAFLLFLLLLALTPRQTLLYFLPALFIPVAAFFATNYLATGSLKPTYTHFGGPEYEYAGSHWKLEEGKEPSGIDFAYLKEGRDDYAFHLLLGHHGAFSLTPVFLLSLAGLLPCLFGRSESNRRVRWLGALTLVVSAVVIVFYTAIVPARNRNYGGWTIGPRWLIWLTPLWLLVMTPAADWLGRRAWGRGLAYLLLAVSIFSAEFPPWNPWRHPWLYRLLDELGHIPY